MTVEGARQMHKCPVSQSSEIPLITECCPGHKGSVRAESSFICGYYINVDIFSAFPCLTLSSFVPLLRYQKMLDYFFQKD